MCVKKLALSGFARNIKFAENYDPSLPFVLANRDQFERPHQNVSRDILGEVSVDCGNQLRRERHVSPAARQRQDLHRRRCGPAKAEGVDGSRDVTIFEQEKIAFLSLGVFVYLLPVVVT